MPRKRATRVNKRAKPKVPEGDEGNSLTEEERRQKLDIFLHEYDIKVKADLDEAEKELNHICQMIESRLQVQIMQLPQCVREMKYGDFIASGGTVESALQQLQEQQTSQILGSSATSANLKRTLSRLKAGFQCETILEEQNSLETPVPGANKRKKTGRTATTRGVTRPGRSVLNESSNMAPPTSAMKTRYRTPCQKSIALVGWETPLITPKFDPRLPYTPGDSREARPGEIIMSLAGSPLSNPYGTNKSSMVVNKGNTVTFNLDVDNDLENLDIDISHTQIEKMMSIFSNVLKKTGDSK